MRITQYEQDLRTQVANLGEEFTITRSEIKRHARAIFDFKRGEQVLARGMTVQELSAAATVLANLFATPEITETEEVTETSEMATEDSERMPEEADVE